MYCMSIDDDYLPCNDCKKCEGLTCNECDFYDSNFGCCLSKCDFKYSDVGKHSIKEAKQYERDDILWR